MKSFFLSRRLAAKYIRENFGIRCSEKWLAKLVVTGGGPKYYKDGRSILYARYDLDAWATRRISGPYKASGIPFEQNECPSLLANHEGLPIINDADGEVSLS